MSATSLLNKLEDLVKALELGSQMAIPGTQVQGSALQIEDCSPVMHNVCFGDKLIKFQKEFKSSKMKGQLFQFNRTISYGNTGSSAQMEGAIGREDTGSYVRAVVPIAYYAQVRRVTDAANMAETVDGVKAEDRESDAAAKVIAFDIEKDLILGKSEFSNQGVFDGDPQAVPDRMAGMLGLDIQVRQSDSQLNSHDLMFEAFGGNLSNVMVGGGTLAQTMLEDAWMRGILNHGTADTLYTDPLVLSAYSKASYANKERIVLSNSAAEPVVGADVRKQAVSGGVVKIEPSRFLTGQTRPKRPVSSAPGAPSAVLGQAAGSTSFLAAQVFTYFVTGESEMGESLASAASAITIAVAANSVSATITPGAGVSRWFNVFRSAPGGTSASAKLIGRVKNSGGATTVFTDLNNRLPGGIAGYLLDPASVEIKELSPYSRKKLADVDLTKTEAHFRFCCLAVFTPRVNVILDNLTGSL